MWVVQSVLSRKQHFGQGGVEGGVPKRGGTENKGARLRLGRASSQPWAWLDTVNPGRTSIFEMVPVELGTGNKQVMIDLFT